MNIVRWGNREQSGLRVDKKGYWETALVGGEKMRVVQNGRVGVGVWKTAWIRGVD
jgi:hypothetical protein